MKGREMPQSEHRSGSLLRREHPGGGGRVGYHRVNTREKSTNHNTRHWSQTEGIRNKQGEGSRQR